MKSGLLRYMALFFWLLLCAGCAASAQSVMDVASSGNVQAMQRLLQHDPRLINVHDGLGRTPLHYAVWEGKTAMVHFLVEQGADIEAKSQFDVTPLHWAIERGQIQIAEYLIQHGANVNAVRTEENSTALDQVARLNDLELAELLLARGADINARNRDDWTPFFYAANSGNISLMRLLLRHGAGFDVTDKNGDEPIHVAAANHQSASIALLIASGQDIDTRNEAGETPLAVAARNGQVNVMQFLIGAGANIQAKNKAGQTPLDEAIQAKQAQAIDLLRLYQNALDERATRDAIRKSSGIVIRSGYQNWAEPTVQAKVIYNNDFASGKVGSEWSTSPLPGAQQAPLRVSVTPIGSRHFLGDFGSQAVRLTLKNLPPHKEVSLDFDLFILRAWQGNDMYVGPHLWSLGMPDGPTLLRTTFANYLLIASPDIKMQAYPGEYAGDHYTIQTGADATNTLGYTYNSSGQTVPMDSVYKLSYTFPHTGAILLLDFAATGLQELSTTSWGITNVQVSVAEPAPAPIHRAVAVRPTPTRTVNRFEPRNPRAVTHRVITPKTRTRATAHTASARQNIKKIATKRTDEPKKRLHAREKPPTP